MHKRKLLSEAADNRATPVFRGFVCIVRPTRQGSHSGGWKRLGVGDAAVCFVGVAGGIFIFWGGDRLRNASDVVIFEGLATA
jgi:hypothetical protein